MSSYKIGYARVITLQQDAALQRDALHAAGVDRILLDKASGKLESRPALDDRLEQARPGDILRGRNPPDQFNDGPFACVGDRRAPSSPPHQASEPNRGSAGRDPGRPWAA